VKRKGRLTFRAENESGSSVLALSNRSKIEETLAKGCKALQFILLKF